MKTWTARCAGALAFLLAAVILLSSAFASGEPRPPFSGEPSGEVGLGALMKPEDMGVIGEVLYRAAGVSIENADDLAALLAEADIPALAAELRIVLDMTQLMTDEELRTQIESLALAYGYSFTDAELDAIVRLCRSFEPLTEAELRERLEQMQGNYLAVQEVQESLSSLGDRLQMFLQKIAELIRSLLARFG